MLEHRRGLEPKSQRAERGTPQARNPEAISRSSARTAARVSAANDGALTMSTIEKHEPHSEAEAWKYAEKALTWYGWGSPVGISIFLVAIGIVLVLIHQAGLLR
jgi:hypothetical protein